MRTLLSASALALGVFSSACPAATTLTDAWAQVAAQDPQLAAEAAHRDYVQQARPQARAALLPAVTADGGELFDRTHGNFLYVLPQGLQSATEIVRSRTPEWDLTLHQSLFNWTAISQYREATLKSTQAELEFQGARQSALLRTAEAYFSVLAAHEGLAVSAEERDALVRQLAGAQLRFDLGTTTRTDVESARAAAEAARARVLADQAQLATARYRLAELTGQTASQLAGLEETLPLTVPNPDSPEAWADAASLQNSALNVARVRVQVAALEVSATQGERYPKIELIANQSGALASANETLYGVTTPANNTRYDRQIGIVVRVPIFSGGKVSSDVRESEYAQKERLAELEHITRDTRRITQEAYLSVLSDIAQVRALKLAADSSALALHDERIGYEAGAHTLLEVLLATTAHAKAQREWSQARYAYLIDEFKLHYAAGDLDEGLLGQVEQGLGPEVTLD